MLNRFKKDEGGFTLIELLVVILIIGILAAIALPTFLGQREKAQDASAKADLRNAVTQVESCIADNSSPAIATACTAANITELPTGVSFAAAVDTNGLYKMARTSDSSGKFYIEKTGAGKFVRTCDDTTKGCKSGAW